MGIVALTLRNSKCHGLSVQPYVVLVSTWAVPSQPCAQSGKRRWFSCTTRSTIARLPSGASPSQLRAIFAPSALFPGISRRCTRRVGGTSSHPRSARAVSFGVRLRIHSHLCGLWFRAEYSPSPYPRTSAASAQSRCPQRLRPRG